MALKKVTKIESVMDMEQSRKFRTAAYCRVSTGSEEQLSSLSAQITHYKSCISANPDYIFAGIYYDEGISGTKKENRDGLNHLIADCELRKIDLILVKSISRLARKTTDSLEIVRKLCGLGIGIFFESENINTLTFDSEVILSILSSMAASESVSISLNNKWGIKKRFQDGTFKLSYPPYGYDYDGETIVPNPETSKIVKRIFTEILDGKGYRMIAAGLNKDGILSPKGKKWLATAICGIAKNEKYTGDVLFQKTYTDINFNCRKNNSTEDQYFIQNHHAPIISREEFEAAGNMIKMRGLEKGIDLENSEKYICRYIFSSIIECGSCKTNFRRRIHNQGRLSEYIAWACTKHIDSNGKGCSMLFVREEQIKSAFVIMMNKLLSYRIEILTPLIEGLKAKDSDGRNGETDRLKDRLSELAGQGQTITALFAGGYLEPALYKEKKNILQTEAVIIREQIEILSGSADREKSTLYEAEELYRFLYREAKFSETFSEDIFKRFVSKIIVLSDTEIGFQLKCGLTLKERLAR